MSDRLIALEEKIAHLERHVETLDGLVRELFDTQRGVHDEMARLRTAHTDLARKQRDGTADDANETNAGPDESNVW